jgi:hypothetical protein
MTFALTTPVTGGAQTGFTTPGYTITADTPPNSNSKQFVVTALTGTQAGVVSHSVSSPFSVAMFRPQSFQVLAPVNAVTGVLMKVPMNNYKLIVRKGVTPLAGQASKPLVLTLNMEIPAGADTADAPNIRAAFSLLFGAVAQISSGIGDTVVQGVL